MALLVTTACAGRPAPVSGTGARGSPPPAASTASSPTSTASAPAAPVSPTVTSSPGIVPAVCTRSAGTLPGGTVLQRVDVAAHTGFDRVSFAFAPVANAPGGGASFTITPVTPPFRADPSGGALDVSGQSFLLVRFLGGYGYDPVNNPPQAAYTGLHDLRPWLAAVAEVVERGDFEGVLSWIVGLQPKACWHAFTLAGPARLVVDVPSP